MFWPSELFGDGCGERIVLLIPGQFVPSLKNVIEAAQTGVRRSGRLTVRKSSPGNFGFAMIE